MVEHNARVKRALDVLRAISSPEWSENNGKVHFPAIDAHPQVNFSVNTPLPAHDPAAWAEDFHRWTLNRCCFRDRCFGGIGALHADFCEHQMARNDVPCQRSVFEMLLRDAGFFFADGLVSGLILKTEYEAQSGKRAPAPGCAAEAFRESVSSPRT